MPLDILIDQLRSSLPTILDLEDISSILRVSRFTVEREIKEARLKGYQIDGEWNVNREDLIAYIEDCAERV